MSIHEDLVRACKLEQKQVHDTYEKAVKTQSVLIWHPQDDIQKISGLEGQFFWPEGPLPVGFISFKFDPNSVDPDGVAGLGTYTLARAGITVEQGDFRAVANNPLFGYAAIELMPQNSSYHRVFVILGMLTDDKWVIYSMELEKMGPHGQLFPPPFWASRLH